MRTMPLALAFALLAATAASARSAPSEAQLLAGRTAGPPRSCISEPQIGSTDILDSGAILYRMNAGPDYLNRASGCRGILRHDSAIASSTPSSSICRGDIIRVFDPVSHVDYGSCSLDDFIPYARPKIPKR